MAMSPDEQEFTVRKLQRGLEYRAKAQLLTNEKIAQITGHSKNAIKKVTGPGGKDHPAYPVVMPYIKERDRYRSKAFELEPEQVARSMGHPLDEVMELYRNLI